VPHHASFRDSFIAVGFHAETRNVDRNLSPSTIFYAKRQIRLSSRRKSTCAYVCLAPDCGTLQVSRVSNSDEV
jgi:hypothetical protein